VKIRKEFYTEGNEGNEGEDKKRVLNRRAGSGRLGGKPET
jgi:hypothetical protein